MKKTLLLVSALIAVASMVFATGQTEGGSEEPEQPEQIEMVLMTSNLSAKRLTVRQRSKSS